MVLGTTENIFWLATADRRKRDEREREKKERDTVPCFSISTLTQKKRKENEMKQVRK